MLDSVMADKKVLIACVAGSVVAYYVYQIARRSLKRRQLANTPFVEIGEVTRLVIYPVKSCKGVEVTFLDCGPLGPSSDDMLDREFMIINGDTGKFYTARALPMMVMIECYKHDDQLHLKYKEEEIRVALSDVRNRNVVVKAKLHCDLRQDGLDCGDEAAAWLDRVCGKTGMRLVQNVAGLFSERTCVTDQSWWTNNEVPRRRDDAMFADLAPYMITTESSLAALNDKMAEDGVDLEVSSANFRANLVVSGCGEWQEDEWMDIRVGDAQLQCFKPCTRCILTCVNPETGERNDNQQPLRTLRKYRMAPAGVMLDAFKDSPIFGVNAALAKKGRIQLGQKVYARLKPSPF